PEAADPARLSALLVGTVDVNDGVRYGTRQALAAGTTGTVELLVLEGREGYDDPLVSWGLDEASAYYPPLSESDGAEGIEVPVSEVASVVAEVPTTVVPDDLGRDFPVAAAQMRAQFPTLVMPARAVRASASALGALRQGRQTTWAYFYARLAEGADASQALRGMTDVATGLPGVESLGTTNLAAVQRDARAVSFTVRVFLYCFAAILALIAVANVFNTIASGMMLRAREFAALRSAGMGERAFRRMILVECADYALRGLALGALLSLVVELFLWQAMSLSVSGITPAVPWAHIAMAFALVVAVLAASAIYALRKTHAMNLVEALRADAL
ncbi:ABC transporter permease, partial [Thermophilibacter provencensis]|uniref:ABC transporter permease n=1 Tax=Thermophilibacter provencensis TaxID=1852386 RepID=UPI003AA9AAA8